MTTTRARYARLMRTVLRQLYETGDLEAVSEPMQEVCDRLVRCGMMERIGGSYLLTPAGNEFVARGDACENGDDGDVAQA